MHSRRTNRVCSNRVFIGCLDMRVSFSDELSDEGARRNTFCEANLPIVEFGTAVTAATVAFSLAALMTTSRTVAVSPEDEATKRISSDEIGGQVTDPTTWDVKPR